MDLHWAVAIVVGAPVAAVMSRFPLVLNRSSTGIEVGFESAILVFLACFHGGTGALAAWTAGQVLSQLLTTKTPSIRLFNIGLGISCGWAALIVMRAISPLDGHDVRELAAVTFGVATFFVIDYCASAVSIALEEGRPVTAALRQTSALAALGTFVAIDSLGYLAALVVRALPGWPGLLLAVPLVTILVATRALSRGNEHRRRLSALFDAAAEAQVVHSRSALEDLLRRSARAAVAQDRADLRDDAPSPKEIGARVRTGTGRPLARLARPGPGAGVHHRRPEGPRGAGDRGGGGVRATCPHRGDGPPRQPRRADLAAQPQPLPRPCGARRGPGPSVRRGARRALPRPRRLQGGERQVRACRGGRAAQDRRRAPRRLRPRRGLRRAAGRRRVRGAGGGRRGRARDRGAVPPGPRDAAAGDHDRRPRRRRRREHRGRALRRHRRRHRPAAQRGHGDVPRQGPGQGPVLRLPALAARGERPPSRARGGPAAGDGDRARRALPARRRPRAGPGRGSRGPGPLAAGRRAAGARPLRPGGRGAAASSASWASASSRRSSPTRRAWRRARATP